MQTRFITTEDELVAVKDSWNELIRSDPETDRPFYTWDWFFSIWKHLGKPVGQTLAVLVVEDGDHLAGVLPVVRGRASSGGISYRTLNFCGAGTMPRNTAYADPSRRETVYEAIRDCLLKDRRNWEMLEWANVPESSPFHDFWAKKHDRCGLARIRWRGFTAPFVEVHGSFEDYLATLGGGTRKDLKRRLKKFKDFGDARQVRFYDRPEEIPEALELFFEVHRRSWKGEFVNPHYPEFYREITPILCEQGRAMVAVASLEGRPISAGYLLVGNDTYYSLVNDHDMEFRGLSPGILLFIHELNHLIDRGMKRFDFCGTAYDYKDRLSSGNLLHSTFQIFHGGLKSRFLYKAKTSWLPMLRKLLRKPEPDDMLEK